MQRKSGYPVVNCNIKMPDCVPTQETTSNDEDGEQLQRRQQLINFGHVQWGFNNWSWGVTKQEVDFVDFSNGKYAAGVAAYISVTVKSFDIHRENVGYATCVANMKGSAIYQARKCAVTNALRETLLSFGGSVATELMEILDSLKTETANPAALPAAQPTENMPENNQNLMNINKLAETNNSIVNKNIRKESSDNNCSAANLRGQPIVQPAMKNAMVVNPCPVAKAHPIPANLPPAANRPLPANAPRPPAPVPPHVRPNPNVQEVQNPSTTESASEEEARAERLRRQRQAQEEFRQKQLLKQTHGPDDELELNESCTSFLNRLIEIPTQDIVIEETEHAGEGGKRKGGVEAAGAKRRASSICRLEIVKD